MMGHIETWRFVHKRGNIFDVIAVLATPGSCIAPHGKQRPTRHRPRRVAQMFRNECPSWHKGPKSREYLGSPDTLWKTSEISRLSCQCMVTCSISSPPPPPLLYNRQFPYLATFFRAQNKQFTVHKPRSQFSSFYFALGVALAIYTCMRPAGCSPSQHTHACTAVTWKSRTLHAPHHGTRCDLKVAYYRHIGCLLVALFRTN